MYSWVFGTFVFTNSILIGVCFIHKLANYGNRDIDMNLYAKNDVPPMWKLVSSPLKERARQWFINRAILKGIDWERLTNYYKLPGSMRELVEFKEKLENTSVLYPDYFLQPFHGYDEGNMNWLAAQENEAASLSMSANYWQDVCAMDSEKWVRNNVSSNVRSYIRDYGFCERVDDFAVKSVKKILDVGCSGGISTEYMRRGFPNATAVYGLDLSPYFVAVSAFRAANSDGEFDHLKYFHANAEKTMFPDGEFDLIICNFLFHEVPRDATHVILNELKRILLPGGVLAIVDLDPDVLKSDRLLNQFRKWAFEVTEPHIYGYYNSDMSENLYTHGFQNVVKKTNDPINAIWLCQKPVFVYSEILGH